jgi:putative transposase
MLNTVVFFSSPSNRLMTWRYYNKVRPHSSLGYRPPAPEALVWPAKPVAQMPALN